MRGAGAAPRGGIIPGKSLPWDYGHEHLYMGDGQISLELSLWGLELTGPLTPQKQGPWVPGKSLGSRRERSPGAGSTGRGTQG